MGALTKAERQQRVVDYVRRNGFATMDDLSAQLDAWLAGGLWLRLARHANAMADRLAAGLTALPGVELAYPVEANEVFVRLPESAVTALETAGFRFHRWEGSLLRLVTAFDTPACAVDAFVKTAREAKENA